MCSPRAAVGAPPPHAAPTRSVGAGRASLHKRCAVTTGPPLAPASAASAVPATACSRGHSASIARFLNAGGTAVATHRRLVCASRHSYAALRSALDEFVQPDLSDASNLITTLNSLNSEISSLDLDGPLADVRPALRGVA